MIIGYEVDFMKTLREIANEIDLLIKMVSGNNITTGGKPIDLISKDLKSENVKIQIKIIDLLLEEVKDKVDNYLDYAFAEDYVDKLENIFTGLKETCPE